VKTHQRVLVGRRLKPTPQNSRRPVETAKGLFKISHWAPCLGIHASEILELKSSALVSRQNYKGIDKMNDDRVWRFEESLWRASEDHYHEQVDAECVMALSHAPYLYSGDDAVKAVSGTPEWESVSFSEKTISRPEEGLIVVGYRIIAEKGEKRFKAACTSVYRRKAHEEWSVVQHSQVVIGAD